ncbi:uncharacterized protein LOC119368364 [Triticum dicoccoides]|uniref:uncharacterized protein LOC119368364 n=1 Tax=Triticum dicoccoides TaxID=85692 RepID=UPI00188F5A71|nr:uncharacterized protein LOC119368364 [Triticum dicoccoides]
MERFVGWTPTSLPPSGCRVVLTKRGKLKRKVGRRRATVHCYDCLFLLLLSVTGKRTKCGRVSIRSPVDWLRPLSCCWLAVPLLSVSSPLTHVAPSTGGTFACVLLSFRNGEADNDSLYH